MSRLRGGERLGDLHGGQGSGQQQAALLTDITRYRRELEASAIKDPGCCDYSSVIADISLFCVEQNLMNVSFKG